MIQQEIKEELRADMMLEAKQEAYHDKKARDNIFFALLLCGDEFLVSELIELLEEN